MGDCMKIGDLELNCRIEGNGRTMVLLHGWGANMQMMQFIQSAFSKTYTVLNMDLPGFGKSEEPHEVWTIKEYANMIHEVLMQHKLTKPILVAHSFGARIAFCYASLYDTEAVIATGAAGLRPRNYIYTEMKIILHKMRKKLTGTGNKGSSDYQNASYIMKGIMIDALKHPLQKELLQKITCPVLLIWGEYDQDTPIYMGKKLAIYLKDATLVLFEDDDHFAYFHQAGRFIKVMRYYLEGMYETTSNQ